MIAEKEYEALLEQAREMGADHGKSAASWYFDGNTTQVTYARVLSGYEDGDPEVMDTFPLSPLSGEWAEAPTPRSVLTSLGDGYEWTADDEPDAADSLLNAYEDAFYTASTDAIVAEARRMAEVEDES